MAKDKQWLLCIDVTIWASALSGDDADWRILLSLINEVRPTDMQLMYREELEKLGGASFEKHWLLVSKLSKISTTGYGSATTDVCVKTNPELLTDALASDSKQEMICMLAYLYDRKMIKPRPILSTKRTSSDKALLTKENESHHCTLYVCGVSQRAILERVEALTPKLNQAKHYMFERNMGKGKIASTFSAYDRNNLQPALELLQIAFQKYDGEDLPAPSLWAWDEKHHCYVQFMHSINNEYHGHDEKTLNKVPDSVRELYGK